jgi:hypothetical protein
LANAAPLAGGGQPSPAAPRKARVLSLSQASLLHIEIPNFTLFGEVPETRLRGAAEKLEIFREALQRLHPGLHADAARPLPLAQRNAEVQAEGDRLASAGL